jgi:hypothetical protein
MIAHGLALDSLGAVRGADVPGDAPDGGIVFTPLAAISATRLGVSRHPQPMRALGALVGPLDGRVAIRRFGDACPPARVLIAAKHQSFFDIILMVSVLDRPKIRDEAQPALGAGPGLVCLAGSAACRWTGARRFARWSRWSPGVCAPGALRRAS